MSVGLAIAKPFSSSGSVKNEMIIAARQQVRFTFPDPFFLFVSLALGTVTVSAGVVTDAHISAFVARIDVTTQS